MRYNYARTELWWGECQISQPTRMRYTSPEYIAEKIRKILGQIHGTYKAEHPSKPLAASLDAENATTLRENKTV